MNLTFRLSHVNLATKIELSDLGGNIIISQKLKEASFTISLPGEKLAPGIYVASVSENNKLVASGKFAIYK
jgi:hypothetical protein